jgi:negative regulator of replication initiation
LSSQADELQKQGYELLTTTFSKDNAAFAQAVTDFDSKTEEFFTNFTRPHLSKGRELNFFAVPQKVP